MRVFNLAEELEKERKKNKELKELCNKYEEEHKTVFERWKKGIKIIDELEKYLKEQVFNRAGSSIDLAIENHSYCKVLDKLNELKGDNK